MVKIMNHPDNGMVWGAFSGDRGRVSLYCLFKNITMKRRSCIKVLEECYFMHDGSPAHMSMTMTKFLDHGINVLECSSNSFDFNPIENARNLMKN